MERMPKIPYCGQYEPDDRGTDYCASCDYWEDRNGWHPYCGYWERHPEELEELKKAEKEEK